MMEKTKIVSKYDGLGLEVGMVRPKEAPLAIVQISHGMSEHKERYEDFMIYLAEQGILSIIHDHRGHGNSVKSVHDLGFFYTKDSNGIVEDLHQVTEYIKEQYPKLPVYLLAHSMGTLVARSYLKRYDDSIQKLVLIGPPTKNSFLWFGKGLLKISTKFKGEHHRSRMIQNLVFKNYNPKMEVENSWLSTQKEVVERYNKDPLCGFIFTNNGFQNLFSLLGDAYQNKGWKMNNKALPILMMAGSEDPTIQNVRKLYELEDYLKKRGYTEVSTIVYEGYRHELLNEEIRRKVYATIHSHLTNVRIQD